MKPGDAVPDFEALDDEGRPVKLSDYLAKGPVVLFFYPKAMTTGCTKEACHFRDLAGDFDAVGAVPVGISADAVDRQAKFRDKHGFPFPLLSDTDRKVAGIFGVKRALVLPNKRSTFVIDTDRTLLEAFTSEVNMEAHADQALDALKGRPS
jgi:peroxiredoxin Q/BCP